MNRGQTIISIKHHLSKMGVSEEDVKNLPTGLASLFLLSKFQEALATVWEWHNKEEVRVVERVVEKIVEVEKKPKKKTLKDLIRETKVE